MKAHQATPHGPRPYMGYTGEVSMGPGQHVKNVTEMKNAHL